MKLIVFSGLDSAGKSTQINLLKNFFLKKSKKSFIFWSRGGYTPGFQYLKFFLRFIFKKNIPKAGFSKERKKAFSNSVIRKLWLVVAIIDLIFFYSIYLRIKILLGYIIICDRYIIDTLIDFKIAYPDENIQKWVLWKILNFVSLTPDSHFILAINVDESITRSKMKNEPFPDSSEVLNVRLNTYLDYAKNNDKTDLIWCEKPLEIIHNEIINKLNVD